ncbi:unnamed protein product, partial [Effrenium voratum]
VEKLDLLSCAQVLSGHLSLQLLLPSLSRSAPSAPRHGRHQVVELSLRRPWQEAPSNSPAPDQPFGCSRRRPQRWEGLTIRATSSSSPGKKDLMTCKARREELRLEVLVVGTTTAWD